nr:VCBS repeat-containing protein [candidate division Zixibacteria bacterium]
MTLISKLGIIPAIIGLLFICSPVAANKGGKLLIPKAIEKRAIDPNDQKIVESGFLSTPSPRNILNLNREHPWALPKQAIPAGVVDTIRVLSLRFDFIQESPDDPLTTGNGKYDMRTFEQFRDEEGHEIDPAPHNRQYFESHLQALANYYSFVSDFKVVIEYEVFPRQTDSVYHLSHEMDYYGGVNPYIGLTNYFIDCIQLVDTSEAQVVFGDYDAYFLFHAGADQQNNIGFPDTPSDLYTGYIFFLDTAMYVDRTASDSTEIRDALNMPETASQDNRATAINAVIAHEFGHQLGLIDLYRTDNFFTRLGDFALMDNNGFGTGVDFGFDVGRAFGVSPVYPMAWSRAFLGFEDPIVYRRGTDIELVAAEMQELGTKVAKIPISEYEYYLIENRQIAIGPETAILADSITSVILGPCDYSKNLTGEYDFLIPGSGILIFRVDEVVAYMDFDGDGILNFIDNQLQNDPLRPFVKLMEADGMINFGGIYYSGFGTQEDMYYAGNNNSFTPNTNPPAYGYGGKNTHIFVTDISESDLTMTFDLDYDLVSDSFPQRAGVPAYGLSPIAADLNNDGREEIITASNKNLIVLNDDGTDFTPSFAPPFYDTAYILNNEASYPVYPVPLFARVGENISAGPAVGDFGLDNDTQYVAIGAGPWVHVYGLVDADLNGLAEPLFDSLSIGGWQVVWLAFGDKLVVATMDSLAHFVRFYGILSDGTSYPLSRQINHPELYGASRFDSTYAVIAGDDNGVILYLVTSPTVLKEYDLGGYYIYGPVVADFNRDGLPEVVVATPDGDIKVITLDRSADDPFTEYASASLGDSVYVNPIVSDIDRDGYPDIILGSKNKIIGLDRYLNSLLDFPIEMDRSFPDDVVVAPPVVGDLDHDGVKDIAVLSSNGNCYAFKTRYTTNDWLLYGFPTAAGGIGFGAPVIHRRGTVGGLGIMGIDGWFYSYDTGYDSALTDWPMGGGGAEGLYYFPSSRLGAVEVSGAMLPDDEFFNYPNPTYDGLTNVQYRLGDNADVTVNLYDMSGKRVVDEMNFTGQEGGRVHVIYNWDLSSLVTGVYRCVLEADFDNGESVSAFTDIAIIK